MNWWNIEYKVLFFMCCFYRSISDDYLSLYILFLNYGASQVIETMSSRARDRPCHCSSHGCAGAIIPYNVFRSHRRSDAVSID